MFSEILEYLAYKLKKAVTSRLFPVAFLFFVLFTVLLVRMYRLQVVGGEEAQNEVAGSMIKNTPIAATRGNIYDVNGVLLAYNQLVQNITVTDNGSYPDGYERNLMLLRLIAILDEHGEKVEESLPIYLDENGKLCSNFSSEAARLRFLRDMFGKTSVSLLSEEERAADATDIFNFYKEKFGVGSYRNGSTYLVTPDQALKCLHIRYNMYMNYYVRYNPTTVAKNVSDETVADILEHASELLGVEVEQTYTRKYNNAVYFSHIIGYTGQASAEEIRLDNAAGGSLVIGDIVGKSGIEAGLEDILQGQKGTLSMYVNNLGQVQDIIDRVDPVAGNDVYLSVDSKLQIGIYFLLEQKLAGILISKLVNEDTDPADENHNISVKAAYNQLIGNNVLDFRKFETASSGSACGQLQKAFEKGQQEVMNEIRKELTSVTAQPYRELSEEMQEYLDVLYSVLLSEEILLREKIDTGSSLYIAYRRNGSISLQEYLREAMGCGWVDTSLLSLDVKYTSSEQVYRLLVDLILTTLEDSTEFSKEIYRSLIYSDAIERCDLALALFEQGCIAFDADEFTALKNGNNDTAFEFLVKKISSMEITPAQLALDPCSGAVTIVDTVTGKVKAMVAYPGYDNNRISDPVYYASLLEDESSPLFNAATQAQAAPGSVFKPVTAAAALESGTVMPEEKITTMGVFTEAGMHLECSIYPLTHGDINLREALRDSCNYFFCQVAYDFSLVNEKYNDTKGLEILQKYADLLGLGRKSGVEVSEYDPHISSVSAIASSIGQGNHLYSNVQLARYAATLATNGSIYDLTLIDRTETASGQLVQNYRGELIDKVQLSAATWDNIRTGMHMAMTEGSTSTLYSHNVDLAGKTGTAQESTLRPDHATFVCYAPFESPEIAVAVSIYHGYTSGNTAEVGGYVLDFYFGYMQFEDILAADARDIGGGIIQE